MARLNMPPSNALTPAQEEAIGEVVAGKRGRVPTPMIAWLRNPGLATSAQKLGELLRFETSLNPEHTEIAVLVCARHWTTHVEWNAHKALALEAGVKPEVIEAIARRETPHFDDSIDELVYTLSTALLQTGRLTSQQYEGGIQMLDEKGMVELVATLGYYCLVSLTLNSFELGLPSNIAPDLADPAYTSAGS